MKRLSVVGMAGVMAIVLSSCFVLQGFVMLDTSLQRGQKTTARFTVRPFSTTPDGGYQFFLLGVDDTVNLSFGKGTWGANGRYGGPRTMVQRSGLAAAIDAAGACVGTGGIDFGAVYPSYDAWKGYTTDRKVGDRGTVDVVATADIVVKAKAAAVHEDINAVIAVTGEWVDDNVDGIPDAGDSYYCTGNASTMVFIK